MSGRPDIGRTIMLLGAALVVIGFLVSILSRLGLDRLGFGRLPGDITIRKPNFTFYFPLASCLLLSLLITLLSWLFRRR